jgi:hypothetical protein
MHLGAINRELGTFHFNRRFPIIRDQAMLSYAVTQMISSCTHNVLALAG